MRRFTQHERTLRALVDEAISAELDFFIGTPGPVWPNDLAARGLGPDAIAAYQRQLRQVGVTGISADAAGEVVAFQAQSLLSLGPIKSLVYSPMRPPTVTDTTTEAFRFDPGQFRRVCRPLEDAWYICLDYED